MMKQQPNIKFHIEYKAPREESIYIVTERGAQRMWSVDNANWYYEMALPPKSNYHYELRNEEGLTIRCEEIEHTADYQASSLSIYDRWYDTPSDKPFYSSFFTDGVFRHKSEDKKLSVAQGYILIEVEAPTLRSDEALAITGASTLLGGWNTDSALMMNGAESPVWKALLPAELAGSEYKFVIVDSATHTFKCFEGGENRLLPTETAHATVVRGLRFRDVRAGWKGAGVAIPLFSLRSEQDWGCGEFADLKLMARWAAQVGMSVIQILPINDTTSTYSWRDSYPYNAISSFALHPIYINPQEAASCCNKITDGRFFSRIEELLSKYSPKGALLNKKECVDYEKVIKLKDRYLRALYAICGKEVCISKAYKKFVAENESWLQPYSIFCSLRDKYKSTDSSRWGELQHYDKTEAETYYAKNQKQVDYYSFVQFLLDDELVKVRNYAHRLGVTLKGDIPIGVSPCSVDVWSDPTLYNTSMSAGAPPDAFAEDGQNWGFPTYNWAKMREDDYSWWRGRLGKMAHYFDAYRIDHILGFFRIWEVPRQAKSAILGHFNPSLPYTAEEIRALGFDFDYKRHVAHDMQSSEALFIPYPYKEESYTPRIDGAKTKLFATLEPDQQKAFCAIHDNFFYERHNAFWQECAMRRLPVLIQATKMLTCGEDLGMIPACVPQTMDQEKILALEIERMPKEYGATFGNPASYPYLSVAATSTHDMSTIRGWWREDRTLTQRYWNEVLGFSGEAEKECSGKTARMILEREMLSGSMLAILPLQDWLAIDEQVRFHDADKERINVPANPNHYWRYRMHIDLEQLIKLKTLNESIREIVSLREK